MKWIPAILLALLVSSCELFEKEERAVSSAELANLEEQLLRLSESIPCTNALEWRLTPMGRKACGGPIRFIAYHQSIEKQNLENYWRNRYVNEKVFTNRKKTKQKRF
jgi:hypothetical protein